MTDTLSYIKKNPGNWNEKHVMNELLTCSITNGTT